MRCESERKFPPVSAAVDRCASRADSAAAVLAVLRLAFVCLLHALCFFPLASVIDHLTYCDTVCVGIPRWTLISKGEPDVD